MALAGILTLIILISMILYHNSSQSETENNDNLSDSSRSTIDSSKTEDISLMPETEQVDMESSDTSTQELGDDAESPTATDKESNDIAGKSEPGVVLSERIKIEQISDEQTEKLKEEAAPPYIVVNADWEIIDRSTVGSGIVLRPWDYVGWGGDYSIPTDLHLFHGFTEKLPRRDEIEKARKKGDFQTVHDILNQLKNDKQHRVDSRSALRNTPSVQKSEEIKEDTEVVRKAFQRSGFNGMKLEKINQALSKIRNNLLWGEPRWAQRLIDDLNTNYTPAKGIKKGGLKLKDKYRMQLLKTAVKSDNTISEIEAKLTSIARELKNDDVTKTLRNIEDIYEVIKTKVDDCEDRDKLFDKNLKLVEEFREHVRQKNGGGSGSQPIEGGSTQETCSNAVQSSVQNSLRTAKEEVRAASEAAAKAAEAESAAKKVAASKAATEAAASKAATEAAASKAATEAAASKAATEAAASKAAATGADAVTKGTNRMLKALTAAKDEAIKGATAIKDAGVKALEEKQKRDLLRKALLDECKTDVDTITLYVIGDDIPSELRELVSTLNEDNLCKIQVGNGFKIGGSRHIDFKLSEKNIETLENVGFYNTVKYIRYKYWTKKSDLDVKTRLYADFLLTLVICVFLQALGKGKLVLGSLVDQLASLSLYRKYKNTIFLLLPYYAPFV